MAKRALPFESSVQDVTAPPRRNLRLVQVNDSVPAKEIAALLEDWLDDCQYRQHSPTTLETRRVMMSKLVWFAQQQNFEVVGLSELRQFFTHLTRGHEEADGRFGIPTLTKPLRPATIQTYHNHARTFYAWLVKEQWIEASPMERIRPPVVRTDQICPLTPVQVEALIKAAKNSRFPVRNEALLLFLLDTGVRASELCCIKLKDIDVAGRRCVVLGKGNKYRAVCFGSETAKALGRYLRRSKRSPEQPLFVSDSGLRCGEALTRSGLRVLISKLGRTANLQAVRCSPHTLRHTFAIQFLRNGGNMFCLREMLGHTNLTMTQRYVMVAQADIQNQHREYSPIDRLKRPRN